MGVPLVVSLPSEPLRAALRALGRDVVVVEWDLTTPSPLEHVDIVVPPYLSAATLLANLASLTTGLVQSQSIGYDGVAEILPPGHVFANAASVHETSTAELALALILASQRGIPDFVRDAQTGSWNRSWRPSLADRTVLLVGYGGVGRAIEERLIPFEVNVVRVARRERFDDRGTIYGFERIAELLPRADVVVVGVPLSDATTHLIGDHFLGLVRDGALVVNVSRGLVADTEALVAHASRGRLRLALDVTDPEPLPAGHPLFDFSNVLISPHVGGATSAMLPRMVRLVDRQIVLMQAGEAPVNVVLRS